MKLALLFKKSEYDDASVNPKTILGVEIVNPNEFTDESTATTVIKKYVLSKDSTFSASKSYYTCSVTNGYATYTVATVTAGASLPVPNSTYYEPDADNQYVRVINDLSYMSLEHRRTVISNYSDCTFNVTTKRIQIGYTTPANRAISDLNLRYPMLSDQYVIPFV